MRKSRSKKIRGNVDNPRVVFNESNRYLITQAINDDLGQTISFLTTKNILSYNDNNLNGNKSFSKKNLFFAGKLAEIFASNLMKKGIKKFNFDRGNCRYIGKVKYFCDNLWRFLSSNSEKK